MVTNCDYLRGQTSSLQAGLAALDKRLRRRTPVLARAGVSAGLPSAPLLDGDKSRNCLDASVQETESRVHSLDKISSLDAVVLCLVDSPAFEPSTVSSLIAAHMRTAGPVVISTYGGRRGHPV